MTKLVAGLAIYIFAHLFKRIAPAARARYGDGAKGPISVALLVSVVLIVWGFRSVDFIPVYTPLPGMGHVNNALMLIAVVIFGAGMAKGVIWTRIRHPMLWGTVIWSVAHLLVNGDEASIILFGSIGLWALLEMVLINRAGPWVRPASGGAMRDVALVAISLVVYAAIAGVHIWLGHNPFAPSFA